MRNSPGMAGVDADLDAHPRPERRPARIAVVDAYAHRYALNDLDPVAAGVLRREKRELLRRRRADALDRAMPFEVGIGVHGNRDGLAWADISQLRLLRIG